MSAAGERQRMEHHLDNLEAMARSMRSAIQGAGDPLVEQDAVAILQLAGTLVATAARHDVKIREGL